VEASVGGTSLLAFLAFTLNTSDVPEEKVLSTEDHEHAERGQAASK
jgi:hypothetical protein